MTTSANDPASPSTPAPRRTTFGWSDLVVVRIPKEKAELLANAPKPAPSISFAPSEQVESERAIDEVHAEIAAQASRRLSGAHPQREFPYSWLVETIRERFDDPATIALLAALAGRHDNPTATDDYWRDQVDEAGIRPHADADFLDLAAELYEEWLEARPERMVPPAETRPAKAEAIRLRRAGHEYWAAGEKGKGADCFAQALDKLLGPDPDALGAMVMDHSAIRSAKDDFLDAWSRLATLDTFLRCSRSDVFRRGLLRGDRSNLTRGEVECIEALHFSEDFDLKLLVACRDEHHGDMERIRKAVRRTGEGGLDVREGREADYHELVDLTDDLIANLAAIGVSVRR